MPCHEQVMLSLTLLGQAVPVTPTPGAALSWVAGDQVLVLNLPCCVTFGNSWSLSGPLCPYVQGKGLDLLLLRSPLGISA